MLFNALLLPLAVSAAVVHQNVQRDVAEAAVANVEIDKLVPRYRKTAQRNRYKIGPFTMNGAKDSAGSFFGFDPTLMGQSHFYRMPKQLCNSQGACTILAGKVGIMYTDGTEANPENGIYIHHILTSDSTKKSTPWLSNCGSTTRPAMNIAGMLGGTAFVGTGEDSADGLTVYTSEDGTQNTGYHVGADDTFTGWAQLVNYNKESKQLYVYYDLEFVPGIVGEDIKTATFTATCGTSPMIKLSTSGPTNTTSGAFRFMESGKIMGARGHLHDGGVKVDLLINNKFVCSSDAVYGNRAELGTTGVSGQNAAAGMGGKEMGGHSHGGKGDMKPASGKADTSIKTIALMTPCKGPIRVKKGDSLNLIAEYDLSKHPLRESVGGSKAADVMGMMALSFAADK